jgi:hypothetical protein
MRPVPSDNAAYFVVAGVARKNAIEQTRPRRSRGVFWRRLFPMEGAMKQVARTAVGFAGLAADCELGSLLAPTLGWVVTLATMFAVAGIADQVAKRLFQIRL